MIRLLFSSLLIAMLVAGCHTMHSQKTVRNDIEMLYGAQTLKQLYFDYPKWQEMEEAYQPDAQVIQKLSALPGPYQVKIFMATWCSDSRREVPHFMHIIKAAGLEQKMDINMWAVDRKLKLDSGLSTRYQIEKVPTFIFYQNGQEIGRIIESPNALTLEADLLTILTSHKTK